MNCVDDLQKTLMRLLDSIGTHKAEQKRDSIHIVRGRAFIGVYPKKSYLGVNVVLNHPTALPRAAKVEQVSANRFHHFYKIRDKKELDKSFDRLLREAYDLAQPKK
jgi:hypothetical protein